MGNALPIAYNRCAVGMESEKSAADHDIRFVDEAGDDPRPTMAPRVGQAALVPVAGISVLLLGDFLSR